ncbi:hypothetical protein AMJ86_01025 [bacterium SM23_57]|nr:MAG: hypothetical protein AMJ86_01025 [bacterium SM23_57]
MSTRHHSNFIYFFILLFISCSEPKLNEQTVAVVGKEKITAQELLLSYELLPHWTPSKRGAAALRAHLELLIQKKLFANEGRRRGYNTDPVVKKIVEWFENEELRKAVYRTEIEESIEISEEDLLQAYHKNNIQLHVRHLFAKTEKQVKAMQQALNDGIPWEEIAKVTFRDSMLANNGGDLGWLGFGDLEGTFEDSAFAQRIGQISQPVRTRYGYHLIQVLNVRKNILTSQADFEAKKPKLEKMLFRRQEKRRSSEFVKKFMAKKNVKMINKTFDLLVSKIRDDVIDSRSPDVKFLPAIKDGELNQLSLGLEAYRDEVLITYNDGEWTMGDFLEKLRSLPITRRPRLDSPVKFRRDLGMMIRDDFLAEEARGRGLAQDPQVQKEAKHWEDEYTFSYFWQSIEDTISVTDEQVRAFFEKHRARYWLPDRVHIQEILVQTRSEAFRIIRRLKGSADFSNLAKTHSLRTSAAQKGGDLGWIALEQMGNISTVAFQLEKGTLSEPIQVEGGYSVIKVLGKKKQRQKTFDEAKSAVLTAVRRQLSREVYNQWVERLKSKTKIQINDSLLVRLGEQIETGDRILMPGTRKIN